MALGTGKQLTSLENPAAWHSLNFYRKYQRVAPLAPDQHVPAIKIHLPHSEFLQHMNGGEILRPAGREDFPHLELARQVGDQPLRRFGTVRSEEHTSELQS